jgi:hypothetical protein
VTYFKVLFRYFLGGIAKNPREDLRSFRVPAEFRTSHLPNKCQESYSSSNIKWPYTLITIVSVSFPMTANSFFICSVETLDRYFYLVSCISLVISWPSFRIILCIMLRISCRRRSLWCRIWDPHSGAYEEFYLLACNASWSFESQLTFRRKFDWPSSKCMAP